MNRNFRKIAAAALTAVMAASMLAACGGSKPAATTAAPAATQAAGETKAEAAAPAATEAREDLVICMPDDLETFDPVSTSAMATMAVLKNTYIRLYGEDELAQPIDWLAKEFNVISDNEIQIVINTDYKFSDGTPITTEDVAFCLNRAHESPNFSTLMKTVESFEVVDDSTIAIKTTGPSPSIKLALMHCGTSILPKAYVEKATADGDWSNPVCSGPYVVDSRTVGEFTKIAKNPEYVGDVFAAENNSLTFKYVPEGSTRTIMVETGEADVNFNFATADYARCAENADLTIHEAAGTITQYIGMDCTLAPFDDPKVRQALEYAVDRNGVMTVVIEGLGTESYQMLPPATPGHLENPCDYTYDPEKAKALLAEAGYPDGFDTKLLAFNDNGKRIAEMVQMYLAEVGVNAEIETYDASVRLQMIGAHQVPMFAGQWGAMSDADLVLPRLFTKDAFNGMNFAWYDNEESDALLEQARATYDVAERTKLYEEANTIITSEAPWIPLYVPSSFCLTRAGLQGVEVGGESIVNVMKLHY